MENKGYNSTADVSSGQGEGHEKPPLDTPTVGYSNADATIDMEKSGLHGSGVQPPSKPYAGMGKEDLLRFSQTPFLVRLRMGCLILFWLAWFALLAAIVALTIVLPRCAAPPSKSWWQKSVMYQVYVRSYQDSDGDGIGDLKGIESRLDHLEKINAKTLVLSSIFQSHKNGDVDPDIGLDYGYDVTDYQDVDQDYGTMAEFESLIAAVHKKGMKIVLDFVPNHSGIKHPWFQESRNSSATSNPYWNYYVWADCTPDIPPTNWLSVYGNSSWTFDSNRGQCYLHQFLSTQPDLNLRSSAVRQELTNIMRFWLDKGVDGFRINSVDYLYEDTDLGDEEDSGLCAVGQKDYQCLKHDKTFTLDENYELVGRWRSVLDGYSASTDTERILITDSRGMLNQTVRYYMPFGRLGSHLPMNFGLSTLNASCDGKCVHDLVDSWIYNKPRDATSDWLTGYQDIPRFMSQSADRYRAALMLTMTLPGVPISYYGEEIGMVNGQMQGTSVDPAGKINADWSRDPFRTPMQWDQSYNAGFVNGTAQPWLPVNGDQNTTSVMAQDGDSNSILSLYMNLTKIHTEEGALEYGSFHYALVDGDFLTYIREFDGTDRFLIVLNFGQSEATKNLEQSHYMIPGNGEVVLTTGSDVSYETGKSYNLREVKLSPGQGVIFKWDYGR